MDLLNILPFLGLAFLSLALTFYLIQGKLPLIDTPNERSSHLRPIPRSGGISIVLISLLGMWALDIPQDWEAMLEASVAIAIMGLIDDWCGMPALTRLCIQGIAALWVCHAHITLGGDNVFALLLMVAWIVAVTNAFNFMDGLNGMVGGSGVIIIATLSLGSSYGAIVACLGMAVLGFLPFNLAGRIFMGDTGSQFLGFLLSTLALQMQQDISLEGLAVSSLLFLPFLIDTGLTLIKRAMQGENILQAHKQHLYQRLHQQGWSHLQVSLLYWGATSLSCLGYLFLR